MSNGCNVQFSPNLQLHCWRTGCATSAAAFDAGAQGVLLAHSIAIFARPSSPPPARRQTQVGLLVSDTRGGIATAKKTFTVEVATPPAPAPAAPAAAPTPAAPAPAPAAAAAAAAPAGNAPPAVRPDLSFVGFAGGAISIAGAASDADGDPLTIRTTIIGAATPEAAAGAAPPAMLEGTGDMVSLAGVTAGDYTLLITATDSKGASGAGVASVKVFPGDLMAVAAAAEASTGGAAAPTPVPAAAAGAAGAGAPAAAPAAAEVPLAAPAPRAGACGGGRGCGARGSCH